MKIKVVEFENFDQYEESRVSGESEVIAIVGGGKNGTVCADLMTECKSWKTAVKRFFGALEGDARFEGWKDSVAESAENGFFEWIEEEYKGGGNTERTGRFFTVEDYDGEWYIALRV